MEKALVVFVSMTMRLRKSSGKSIDAATFSIVCVSKTGSEINSENLNVHFAI